jgi:hypothetical protein
MECLDYHNALYAYIIEGEGGVKEPESQKITKPEIFIYNKPIPKKYNPVDEHRHVLSWKVFK